MYRLGKDRNCAGCETLFWSLSAYFLRYCCGYQPQYNSLTQRSGRNDETPTNETWQICSYEIVKIQSFYHACMIRDKLNFFSLSGMNEAKRESRRLSSRGRRKLKQSIRNAIKDSEIPKALNLVGHLVSIDERSNKQNYWVCKHLGFPFPNYIRWKSL